MAGNENGVGVGELAIGETKQVVVEAPEAIPVIAPLTSPDGYGQVVVVRDGYDVKRLEGRDEGQRRHTFDDIASFAAYLKRHADAEQTEILLDENVVRAAMDPKIIAPEIIECRLDRHPTFKAFEDSFHKPLSQREFHSLVRGFRPAIEDSEGILNALRVLSVGKTGEVQSEIDETGATRLNLVSERLTMAATVPPEFVLNTPVYQGIVDEAHDELLYKIEVLVSINVEKFQFTIEAPALALVKAKAREDVGAMLARLLGDPFMVGLGKLDIFSRKVYATTEGSD